MKHCILAAILFPMVALAAPGCEEGAEMGTAPPAQAAAPAEAPPPAAAQPSSGRTGLQPGSSSLGAAKRQAKSVVGQVENRQKEISRQIDKDNGNDG